MITVLMPSRGREAQAAEARAAFDATKVIPTTKMLTVVDMEEPGYAGYDILRVAHEGGMANALNAAAQGLLLTEEAEIIGFVGDDHRFRTPGWDLRIAAANQSIGGGIVYGNDLIRGEELPSAVFMDARIVQALGWMALPGCRHLYLDDTWRELGKTLGRLRYLPDVVIEHLHPIAGKANWDDNYARVNDPANYDHDRQVYDNWFRGQRIVDAMVVARALG